MLAFFLLPVCFTCAWVRLFVVSLYLCWLLLCQIFILIWFVWVSDCLWFVCALFYTAVCLLVLTSFHSLWQLFFPFGWIFWFYLFGFSNCYFSLVQWSISLSPDRIWWRHCIYSFLVVRPHCCFLVVGTVCDLFYSSCVYWLQQLLALPVPFDLASEIQSFFR